MIFSYLSAGDSLFFFRKIDRIVYDTTLNLMCYFSSLIVTQFWRKKVVEVAKSYPKIQFAVADEESYGDKLKELGLAESGEDVNVGFFDEKGRKYAMDDEFSEDSLTEFIDSCLKGE